MNTWYRWQNNWNHPIKRADRNTILKKYERNISNLWDNIKNANLCLIGISERKEREESIANVFKEIMISRYPDIGSTDRPTRRHIIIKMARFEDK